MSGLFEPAGGCRCASCLERRGYVEQAEVWQARATQAEARVAELEAALLLIVETSLSEEDDTFEVADRMQEIAEKAISHA